MSKQQMVAEMLALQDSFNQVVNPQWQTAGYNWARAVWVECAELMDHLGYKWWKASSPDAHQCILEVVDIWHFVMSHELSLASADQVCTDVVQLLEFAEHNHVRQECSIDNQRTCIDRLAMRSAAFAAGNGASLLVEFFELADAFGLDLPDLFQRYIGKNALNRFRQQHGYKQGSYIKQWHGREDNEVLVEVLQQCLGQGEAGLLQRVLDALEPVYAQVKRSA
jgi:dimeric dUTPase (all-alpha-NTP-PPase superfamily)